MEKIKDSELLVETYDVFQVIQLTRETSLAHVVAADFVRVAAGKSSEVHRHNAAETVLFILAGSGLVFAGDSWIPVQKGDRIRIGKGVFHGVRTGNDSLSFISVQSPPILDKASGVLDLEPLKEEVHGGRNA